MINVSNNRHVTDVVDFVHLTTHVVDGKLFGERVASVSFKVDSINFAYWVTQKCSRREEKNAEEKNVISLEMDVRREVKRVA